MLNDNLLSQWHPTLNDNINPKTINPNSPKKAWWMGECGHEWEASISNRSGLNSGCPYCTGKKVFKGLNDLATTRPELAKEWHPTKNTKTIYEVSHGSMRKVWWVCKHEHDWEATVNSRSKGNGCPYCGGSKVWAGFNDLGTTHPELAKEVHPTKNEQNLKIRISKGSHRKIWWLGACGHEWEDTVKHRAIEKRKCHYCNGLKLFENFNTLLDTHPDLVKEWHPYLNQNRSPNSIKAGSGLKVWWNCSIGHNYKAIVNDRKNGSGCPVCNHKQLLTGFNDFATIYPELAKEWHPAKNTNKPSEIISFTQSKYWWLGDCGHEWKSRIQSRTRGSGCPTCANYGFSPDKPAILYLIRHKGMNAIKIGITNISTDRMQRWVNRDWQILLLLTSKNGSKIKDIERELKQWVTIDQKESSFLTSKEVGSMGGWTETFQDGKITNKIAKYLSQIDDPEIEKS